MAQRHHAETAHDALAARKGQLRRVSRSEQVADIVREAILDGTFRPGGRLSEPEICAALDVSRNTLREAFRILVEERLVLHELNRGVFVRTPTLDDVAELYTCRRLIECAALHDYGRQKVDLTAVAAAVQRAEENAAAADWIGVGSADIDFHRALTALTNSVRIIELMGSVWNELRLLFYVIDEPHGFHGAYLDRNRAIYEALKAGDALAAEEMLAKYLDDAEQQILDSYRQKALGTR